MPLAVTSLDVTTGPASGGTIVKITGTEFSATPANNVVKFGNVTATVTAATTLEITCTTPAALAVGAVAVEVTVGANSDDLASAFTYTAGITSINLTSGPASGGQTVIITGVGLPTEASQVASIKLSTVSVTDIVYTSATSISFKTGARAANSTPVTLTIALVAGSDVTLTSAYTYKTNVTLSSVAPSFGLLTGGYTATLTGANFTTATLGATPVIKFGGIVATSPLIVSETSITCVVPAHASGIVNVVLTTYTNVDVTLANIFNYTEQSMYVSDLRVTTTNTTGSYRVVLGLANWSGSNGDISISMVDQDGMSASVGGLTFPLDKIAFSASTGSVKSGQTFDVKVNGKTAISTWMKAPPVAPLLGGA